MIAAKAEGGEEPVDLTDFLIEIAALAGLILVLVVAIYLLRRSNAEER